MKWITQVMDDIATEKQKAFIKNFNSKIMESQIPRRNRIDQFTPAEKAIYDAMQEVEKAGADILLTEAIILLQQAKDRVADFVDDVKAAS